MGIYLTHGDLVKMNVDAIVSNANVNLRMVEGVGRAIFHKAGDLELTNELKKYGHCDVGKAVTTPPFGITNTKLLIHAVGPNYINGKHGEEKNLRSAYKEIFKILETKDFKSVAMPVLSSDFNYPIELCYKIQIDECKKYLEKHLDTDIYIVFYKNNLNIFDEEKKSELNKYLYDNYSASVPLVKKEISSNKSIIKEIKKIIGNSNIEMEKLLLEANLKSNFFDKFEMDEKLIPTKQEIISLSIALKLNLNEIDLLLSKINEKLSFSYVSDLIVKFYLLKNIYDIFKINDCLFFYKLKTLSS